MSLRLLWLPHSTNPSYAGVRLRCLLPMAALRQRGWHCRMTADLPPRGARFDVAIVQGKWLLDAADEQAFEQKVQALRRLQDSGTRLAFDSFDNYFVNAGQDSARAQRLQSYRSALLLADQLVVSSPGLVPLLQGELGRETPICVVGDPLEGPGAHRHYDNLLHRCNPGRWRDWLAARALRREVQRARSQRFQLLWFGNHGSAYAVGGMAELEPLLPLLAEVNRQRPLHLRVVSNARPRYEELLAGAGFPHSYSAWHRLHFPALLAAHDLVLLPNRSSAFTQAKSNNRLLLALAAGVPVMADMLPDYMPWQPYYAATPWSALPEVLDQLPSWRAKARAAWPLIESRYGLSAVAGRWAELIATLAPGAGRATGQFADSRRWADSRV